MNFKATHKKELLSRLELIRVPPRGVERTTKHTETWLIQKFLITLNKINLLTFPLNLKNRERPDFELIMDRKSFGIEITEVIHPDYARALTLPEAQKNDSIVDASLFKWGTPKRSLTKLRKIASNTKLTGSPWMGNAVEKEFVKSIIDTINSKQLKFTKGYEVFDNNCLLIYHNQSSPFIDYSEVVTQIDRELKKYWNELNFNQIYIHKNDKLLKFVKNNHNIYDIPY